MGSSTGGRRGSKAPLSLSSVTPALFDSFRPEMWIWAICASESKMRSVASRILAESIAFSRGFRFGVAAASCRTAKAFSLDSRRRSRRAMRAK